MWIIENMHWDWHLKTLEKDSIGVRQHVSGPTHCRNHTVDLIPSHGKDVDEVEILQQSEDISDHYLVSCKLHLAKTAKP